MKHNVMKKSLYLIFCAFLGAVIAAIVWLFLKIMSLGIGFVWEWLPSRLNFPFYTLAVCVLGGAVIGLYQMKFGDYPEELEVVLGKVKKDKFYPYNNVFAVLIAALLPLLFGASIGPEAGLTGVIVGLCYWAGDHMKFLQNKMYDLREMGVTSVLGVIFNAPLFGIALSVEEKTDENKDTVIPRISKIISNLSAVAGAFFMYLLLSNLFGGGMNMPRIEAPEITNTERIWGIPLVLVGILFGYLYILFEKATKAFFGVVKKKASIILSTVLGGILLGIIGTYLPLTMFSGEEQISELAKTYGEFAPWLLILIGAAKLFLTNVCIKSGWKGGHFFPVIFCGISIGYGVAMLTGLNVAFCLGVITAAIMGVIMRKPIAVTLLLMLCFPVRIIPWLIIASFLGSIVPYKLLRIIQK